MEHGKNQVEHSEEEIEAMRNQAKALLCGLPLEHRHELLLSVLNKK